MLLAYLLDRHHRHDRRPHRMRRLPALCAARGFTCDHTLRATRTRQASVAFGSRVPCSHCCSDLYFNPSPLTISMEVVRPQKFKIDVTDFWSPRVSAALQLVLQVTRGV